MTNKTESDDDSYIIILGSSPGNSMDIDKCNGTMKGEILDKSQIEDAMKDLSTEANMAFKAQFSLADSPSPASLMVASTIITDDRSTEELQKRFGELLDENVVLKETLKQNNESMKEQFMLIASCQEDMLKTHRLHKEKFDETRELVEKLHQENKQLKLDLSRLADGDVAVNNETGESKPGESSAVEFVTSPDEDTIDKLTAQLELVEKQRRQLIVDNEKLSWQKESLENIIDSTSKERDDAKEKLKNIELQLSNKENDHSQELQKLHFIINDLQSKLKSSSSSVSPEQLAKREAYVQQLEGKITYFQNELKKAQIKILDLENIKLEFAQYKSGAAETNKMYKEQIQDLNNRIKEIHKTVFQPVRLSLSPEQTARSEYAAHVAHVKLYDRTLKHLAEYFNALTDGAVDSQAQAAGAAAALRAPAPAPAPALAALQRHLRAHHDHVLTNVAQVRGALSIFEGIFKDYNELLKKSVTLTETKPQSQSVEQLTAALLARGQELQALEAQLATLTLHKEDTDLLKAQVDLYKSDFEAERESREKMASEKENLMTDHRSAQKRIQELTTQGKDIEQGRDIHIKVDTYFNELEEIRILSPSMHKSVTTGRRAVVRAPPARAPPAAVAPAPANMAFTCPKCMRFSSDDYKKMEDHFDFCLDDF